MEGIDCLSRFCLKSQGRKEGKFQSLEVRASISHLKTKVVKLSFVLQVGQK